MGRLRDEFEPNAGERYWRIGLGAAGLGISAIGLSSATLGTAAGLAVGGGLLLVGSWLLSVALAGARPERRTIGRIKATVGAAIAGLVGVPMVVMGAFFSMGGDHMTAARRLSAAFLGGGVTSIGIGLLLFGAWLSSSHGIFRTPGESVTPPV